MIIIIVIMIKYGYYYWQLTIIIIIIVWKRPLTVGVPSFQALDITVKPDFQSYS